MIAGRTSGFVLHPPEDGASLFVGVSEYECDPKKVPTIQKLLLELDKIAPSATAGQGTAIVEHRSDRKRTSLKPYVDMLDKHVMGLMEETGKAKQKMGFADLSW